jgi:hypothetical protein
MKMKHTECSDSWAYKIQAYENGTYRCSETLAYNIQAYEDGTYRVFRNVGIYNLGL